MGIASPSASLVGGQYLAGSRKYRAWTVDHRIEGKEGQRVVQGAHGRATRPEGGRAAAEPLTGSRDEQRRSSRLPRSSKTAVHMTERSCGPSCTKLRERIISGSCRDQRVRGRSVPIRCPTSPLAGEIGHGVEGVVWMEGYGARSTVVPMARRLITTMEIIPLRMPCIASDRWRCGAPGFSIVTRRCPDKC